MMAARILTRVCDQLSQTTLITTIQPNYIKQNTHIGLFIFVLLKTFYVRLRYRSPQNHKQRIKIFVYRRMALTHNMH